MLAIAVDHHAGQAVALAPNQTAEFGVDTLQSRAQFQSAGDAAGEEFGIELLLTTRKAAGDDLRLRVVNRRAHRPILVILQRDDIAGLRVAEGFFDFTSIYPLMSVEDARAGLDDDSGHWLIGYWMIC